MESFVTLKSESAFMEILLENEYLYKDVSVKMPPTGQVEFVLQTIGLGEHLVVHCRVEWGSFRLDKALTFLFSICEENYFP